jgi:hypothetical protein
VPSIALDIGVDLNSIMFEHRHAHAHAHAECKNALSGQLEAPGNFCSPGFPLPTIVHCTVAHLLGVNCTIAISSASCLA